MQEHYIQDFPMERGMLVSVIGGVLFLQEMRNRDPFQRAVPCWHPERDTDSDPLPNCETCGHLEVEHGEPGNRCWHGSGNGNRCACLEYVPDASN